MGVPTWGHAAVSIRGKGHEQTQTPCQDACAVRCSRDGRWLALTASDGAGSARHSQISAEFVANEFSARLLDIADELDSRPPGAWVTDAVIEDIVRLRKGLRQKANSDTISDYHCTLVAALIGPSGGFSIHLGDGAVIAGSSRTPGSSAIDLAAELFVSEPENGEYANETVFLTERDWIRHLRIHPLPEVDWLILGTDGGMALAMVDERLPKTGFVLPILRAVLAGADPEARQDAVTAALTDKQADRLTNDDKTLVVAVHSRCTAIQGEFLPPRPAPHNPPAPMPAHVASFNTTLPPLATQTQQPLPNPKVSLPVPPVSFVNRLYAKRLAVLGFLLMLLVLAALAYWRKELLDLLPGQTRANSPAGKPTTETSAPKPKMAQ